MAINDYQMKEIYRKAKSGEGLKTPTQEKLAVYDHYKSKPTTYAGSGINDYQMGEIIRKAQTGVQLMKPTAEKQAIYNSYSNIKKPAEDDYMKKYMDQINGIYDKQRQAQMEQFKVQRDKAVGQINQQKSELAPQYAGMRNQADVVNAQNVSKLRELMAANGLSGSGENVTSQVALGSARQGALNQLNTQEQQQRNDFDRRISDLNDPSEMNAMMAALEAERARAMAEAQRYGDERQYQRGRDAVSDGWRQNQWNYQTGRDSVEDGRWKEQWDYQKGRDQVEDSRWKQQFDEDKRRFESEKAWREYTYKNLSESERRNFDIMQKQFGEEMAWKMYQMNYQGELEKSMNQSQIDFYKNANFNGGQGGLGSLSQKYESSGNPGAIGNNSGDIGGKSYGTYQLATYMGTPQRFVSYLSKIAPDMARYFAGKTPGSGSFDSAWKTLAAAKPKEFAAAQHNFIKASYFDPVVKEHSWILKYPKAVQDAVWSTAVQHGVGGAKNILSRAVKVGMTPQAVINAIYNERSAGGGMKYFSRSSSNVRNSVLNRFARERQDALRMLG